MTYLPESRSWALFLLFPAITMSLGWGLRGFIGGGPLGAMIPGALVTLSICLLLSRLPSASGMIAALGTLGIAFGGEMTYGETVGWISLRESYWWGLTGLTVKGAVWGFLGGAVLGTALTLSRYSRRDLWIGAALLIPGAAAGWALVNHPRWIYFSKSREEVWTGLLLASLCWLAVLGWRKGNAIPWLVALACGLGGGAGFAAGGTLLAWGRWSGAAAGVDFWKLMEFTFGLCFGLAIGFCAWRLQDQLSPGGGPSRILSKDCLQVAAAMGMVLAVIWCEEFIPLRFAFLLTGAMVICLILKLPALAWHVAITLTVSAFLMDLVSSLLERFQAPSRLLPWIAAGASALLIGWLVSRIVTQGNPARSAYLLLLWSAIGVSWIKAAPGLSPASPAAAVQLVFTLGGIALTALVRRCFPAV